VRWAIYTSKQVLTPSFFLFKWVDCLIFERKTRMGEHVQGGKRSQWVARQIDWERIQIDYCVGIKSIREIAAEHGIRDGSIRSKAKTHGWKRDLTSRIEAKADRLVQEAFVREANPTATDEAVIEATAHAQASVRRKLRDRASRLNDFADGLLSELEAMTVHADDFARVGEMMRCPDEFGKDKLNDVYMAAASLTGRVQSGRTVAEMMKNAFTLEREAYGISTADEQNTNAQGKGLIDAFVAELQARGSRLPLAAQGGDKHE
jgi:hypothetical protein